MFYIIYIAFILFFCIPIYQLLSNHLMNNDLLFLICCNYLLNITTALFFGYYSSLLFACISALALAIFATLLVIKMTAAFQRIKFFTLPYLFLCYFTYFFILISCF